MTIDVPKVANLARLALAEDQVPALEAELSSILRFVEQLSEVKTEGVEPMTSVVSMTQRMRSDEVREGEQAAQILANAPDRVADFFAVPKVVE